ncbi:hypothetical protein TorRG33x02_268910 [Trema orientale]|uniref:Uncharacterized protein n=1 Tax=Trema orientale TaxID=63057 RepID=A0A2P5CYG8_TREOI|nr:hypothetical protein TorRG33x02_268910 [Trema orientale]
MEVCFMRNWCGGNHISVCYKWAFLCVGTKNSHITSFQLENFKGRGIWSYFGFITAFIMFHKMHI